ncbi:MAG: DUF6232 family protein [Hyphomicrobiales bacterium]|nr:DUF6232 family protein [Hyphomicrobiales bacterium]
MSDIRRQVEALAKGDSKNQQFDFMTVKDRIIDMGYRSISIPNIASITILRQSNSGLKRLLFALGVGAMILAFASYRSGIGGYGYESSPDNTSSFGLGVIGLFLLLSISLVPKKWYLILSTCDNAQSLFSSGDVSLLTRVKKALDERINAPGEHRGFTANFTNNTFNEGAVKEMRVDKVETIQEMTAETVVSNSPNAMVASNSPGAEIGLSATVSNAPVSNMALNGSASYEAERTYSGAVNAPQTYAGSYDFSQTTIHYVDYDRFIPGVQQFRDYLKNKRPNPSVEAKLDEILELMRSGTPEAPQKSRLRDLAAELSNYAQAYQPLRDLFSGIVDLAGQML